MMGEHPRTRLTRNGEAHGQPVPASILGITCHKKPTTRPAPQSSLSYCTLHCLRTLIRLLSLMGLCLSVALWKEKLYVDRSRPEGGHDEDAVFKEGGCVYKILGGDDDVLEAEEKVVVVAAPAAAMGVKHGAEGAIVSDGTTSGPIWQRKVLMGVKCQLPRFSGMILYDESGRPVCSGVRDRAREQEKHAAAISVLRDML